MKWWIAMVLAALSSSGAMAQAQPKGAVTLVENQAAYLTRCRNDVLAHNPNMRAQAQSICQSNWGQIAAAGAMADSILDIAPLQGVAFDPATVRTVLTSVRWAQRPEQGSIASGRLGDLDVLATRTPSLGATLRWFKDGEPIPFNLEEALRVRGVALTMIGCLAFGAAEDTRVYRAAVTGKAPFALTIARREAAVASQSSDFSAVADFSGRLPTLAQLKRDGSEWTPACPQ